MFNDLIVLLSPKEFRDLFYFVLLLTIFTEVTDGFRYLVHPPLKFKIKDKHQ